MLFGLEWYWWFLITAAVVLSIPLKVKFVKWWSKRQKEQNDDHKDKWGGEE